MPEGSGRPILADGVSTPGEWDDALGIELRSNAQLFLKRAAGFVFLGVKFDPFSLASVDLCISPEGKAMHQLHAGAPLGERLLASTPGTREQTPFLWGSTTGWYANEIRWDERQLQALTDEGKGRDQALVASVYK